MRPSAERSIMIAVVCFILTIIISYAALYNKGNESGYLVAVSMVHCILRRKLWLKQRMPAV